MADVVDTADTKKEYREYHYKSECKIKVLRIPKIKGQNKYNVFYKKCKCDRNLPNRSSEYKKAKKDKVLPESHVGLSGIEIHSKGECSFTPIKERQEGHTVYIIHVKCYCGEIARRGAKR